MIKTTTFAAAIVVIGMSTSVAVATILPTWSCTDVTLEGIDYVVNDLFVTIDTGASVGTSE